MQFLVCDVHICVPLFVWVGITFLPLYSLASVLCTCISMYMYTCSRMHEMIHDEVRQVSDPWTTGASSLLTLGAHEPQGYGTWSVCVCVCVSVCSAPRVLPLRATERPTEGTYGFGVIWLNMAFSLKMLCSKVMA